MLMSRKDKGIPTTPLSNRATPAPFSHGFNAISKPTEAHKSPPRPVKTPAANDRKNKLVLVMFVSFSPFSVRSAHVSSTGWMEAEAEAELAASIDGAWPLLDDDATYGGSGAVKKEALSANLPLALATDAMPSRNEDEALAPDKTRRSSRKPLIAVV
jgi:hypothetical protein